MVHSSTKLARIEELLGYNPQKMAQLGEVSRTTYHRYKSGKSLPSGKFLYTLLHNEKSINANWLIKDQGEPLQDAGTAEEMIIIPMYKMDGPDRRGSTLTQREWEQEYQSVSFDRIFINTVIGLDTQQLIGSFIRGSSSDNLFPDGSLVMVDLFQDTYRFDTYYMVRVGDTYRLFLLQRVSQHEVLLVGGNSHYEPLTYRLDKEDSHIHIIGRVVWVGQNY